MAQFHTNNPYTLERVFTYEKDDEHSLRNKVLQANEAYERWRRLPTSKRVELLSKALSYFAINRDKIARDITAEMGKPLKQSENELKSFFERAEYLFNTAEEALAVQVLPAKVYEKFAQEHLLPSQIDEFNINDIPGCGDFDY